MSTGSDLPGPRATGPLGSMRASGSRPQDQSQGRSPWFSRGYLPHFDVSDIWQTITYRLADSMPKHAMQSMERHITDMPDDQRNVERRERIESWINAGHGSCILRREDAAAMVLGTWQRFAGE